MSHVVEVIIITSASDDDKEKWNELNRLFQTDEKLNPIDHKSKLVEMHEHMGSASKVCQSTIYAGAFNYLHYEELWRVIDKISWERPECLQIFIRDEELPYFELKKRGDQQGG